MATEVGSDIALIQDEDMLRKMWQQTEDFGKKKEIRMRMYKLREQRLKEFYTTGEMIQTETATKRSSTRTHTESITDQGFMTMKTKEIRDSESPTEDYQRQSNTNKNYYVSSKNDEIDNNRGIVQMELTSSIKPNEEIIQSSLQTTRSSSSSSKWESSQTIITESEEIQKADINLSSEFIVSEQNNRDRQLKYDTTFNDQSSLNNDIKVIESITTTNVDNNKQEDNQYSNGYKKVIETYNTTNESNNTNDNQINSISNNNSNHVNNISTLSDNINNQIEITETTTDNKIMNELQKLDSYLSTERSTTDLSSKSSSKVSNEEKNIKNIDDQSAELLKENIEDQYTTTYQNSYQQPRISVDLSPSHEAFARSLRSTPERSSPSPGRERASPERRFKSISPEKYRASPDKSGSPPKSLKSFPKRKLSSTHTKDISKKRANTPTRDVKYDSSDDSDCSGATYGTYDKYKGYDAKRTLFKEEIKSNSTSKYSQKSPSSSPSRREKSPGYSSEGSVTKEVRKSTSKTKNSSHESSPERSAFKPIKNYRTSQTQGNKINHITREENNYTNNYTSKNNVIDLNNHDKIEDDLYINENINKQINDEDTKNKSTQEKFIIEEQFISSEQVDNKNLTNKTVTNREKSPSKSIKKENKLNEEEFVDNEKLNIVKENAKFNDVVITVKSKEKSPLKEAEPVVKYTTTNHSIKATEKILTSTNDKTITPSKKTTSAIPSSVKKTIPTSIEKTPSKKSLIQKDSKDNLSHKTVKKDLSREKVDNKITKSDSKSLIHKNSKENITSKMIIKKPSQEILIDKKTTISSRNKISSPETKPIYQEQIKIIEKKDSKNKLKPSISPQSSQKKFGVIKSTIETKTVSDSKKNTDCSNFKKTPSTNIIKSKIINTPKLNVNETTVPSKGININSKSVSTTITKPQIKKTTTSNLNKTIKIEVTKNVNLKSKDLEDELPPDNFESDTDLENSSETPKFIRNESSKSSSSSSSSSEDEDEGDRQKIKDLDNTRIEAEKEYGKKMTNKDALLNVTVQLPVSSRESSPEYSMRFNKPYCSVSDDASLPRYADVVSEPEDVNDYTLNSSRYDIVTDLDEETNVTVADRVSKFLNNANKQDEIKSTEIPQSPQAVRKTKQIFESIAKGEFERIDVHEVDDSDTNDTEIKNSTIHNSSKNTNNQSFIRKISGSSDYKTRKEFFENKKLNNTPSKLTSSTPHKITRTSSIKDRRASFEAKSDKKTPLQDKTNAPRTKSPESKNNSPDRFAKSPIKINETEILDVKVEETNKFKKLSGTKTVKDRTATFEKNEIIKKSTKENTTTPTRSTSVKHNTGKITGTHTKSENISDTNNSTKRITSPNRSKKSPEKTTQFNSISKLNESSNRKVSSKSPDRKVTEINNKNKNSEGNILISKKEENSVNRVQDKIITSKQQTTTITKNDFGVTVKNASAPKTILTTKLTTVNNIDDETEIEEIFDLDMLEIMLEKAVGYDRRRRIRAQIRVVKRQLELQNGKEINNTTRVTKNVQDSLPLKSQKQSNITVEKTEYVKKFEVKKPRSISPQKPYVNTVANSRSPSPQKTLRSVEETRSPVLQKIVKPTEYGSTSPLKKTTTTVDKIRSPSPQKKTPNEKVRSPSPQKKATIEKVRSPSPKKMSLVKQEQQESRLNKNEKSTRNSTTTTTSTTVTTSTKVKSEQVSTNNFQEQNVTDLITSSYGVGPTDDNGRPLFGLRALRKTNNIQSTNVNESSTQDTLDSYGSVSDQRSKPLFGLKALQNENTCTVQESTTVYQKVSEQKGGVDQLITDHKGKPLFGLKALQSIGKNDEEFVYEDMPEPPVSPQLKELVLRHEKHAKESSKSDTQPRQKPKAKFRDSFILDTKDEGLYSDFQENGFTDPNSVTLHSIIRNEQDDQNNETIVKSKSQSTVFQSKSVMRSNGSGNISVTQDFVKGEVSSVNDQEPSGKVTRGRYTYQSPDNFDRKKGIAKVTTVTTAIGKETGPEITDITEELNSSDNVNDNVDGNKVVKRIRTNDKFESIQKRFSQENSDQSSRRSSKETNGYEKGEESPQTTPRTSLVRGDSIKALQHKFQQATVSSSLKQNKSLKSDSPSSTKHTEEKTVVSKVNSSKSSGPTSFLDNSSRVTGVQDVLTRMRNADLVVESGDTSEDIEARALLNKFLGASVILHGMEQGGKSPTSGSSTATTTTTSASLVNQVEKQRTQKSPVIKNNANEQDLDNIWDEKQLQILLDSCPDYDQRRKIRARLRQIMAEQKACADVVALANTDDTTNSETNGEFKPICNLNLKSNTTVVDDSGTESGEEVNQKILVQVQGALANLESALPALDPLRRSSVVELLTKLQTSLKLSTDKKPTPPPRKCWNKKTSRQDRHTVGVSSEELQDARRWLEENGYTTATPVKPVSACTTPRSYDVSSSKTFRPVKFVPPPPKRTHYTEDYIPEPTKQSLQNNSFAYPPVQHVVIENLDKRRIMATSDRDSTDSSGDVSDDDRSVSSAQRLLKIASNDHSRKVRQSKRVKLKRGGINANEEHSSGDEYPPHRPDIPSVSGGVPPFEPKTANDKKYLALLQQTNKDDASTPVYNPLQGKLQGNWGNRFGRIKTTFERGMAKTPEMPRRNIAKTFWHDICKCPSDDSIAYRMKKGTSFKPVWTGENGFSHAIKSAFKPVVVAQKTKWLEPPKVSNHQPKPSNYQPKPPNHLPLYNSSVATAHRPFIYEDNANQWNSLTSPCSASDLTSCSVSPSADFDTPQPSAISRVMGSPQTASIVKSTMNTARRPSVYPSPLIQPGSAIYPPMEQASAQRYSQAPKPPARSPRLVPQQRSPTTSPVRMPSVLQKSESWHQMIMGQSKAAVRTPQAPMPVPARLQVPPYENRPSKMDIAQKQNMVRQHLRVSESTSSVPTAVANKRTSPKLVKLNDDIDKVDDTFESLFNEATKAK